MKLLVHFPSIAARISGAQLSRLEINDGAGSRFLFELIDHLQQEPAASSAVLLERWRERPEVARMHALAGEELPAIDESGAALELVAAVELLGFEPTLRRYDELAAKGDQMTADEQAELRELTIAVLRSKTRSADNSSGNAPVRR